METFISPTASFFGEFVRLLYFFLYTLEGTFCMEKNRQKQKNYQKSELVNGLSPRLDELFIWYRICVTYRGVEQSVAREAHNLKAAGSSPAPAI